MKDPRQRLSWPELLSHPFIAGRVTGEHQVVVFCLFFFFQFGTGPFPLTTLISCTSLVFPSFLPISSSHQPLPPFPGVALSPLGFPWDHGAGHSPGVPEGIC